MIEFHDVSRRLPGGRFDLRGITFAVEKGEFAFITGPSGAGKTTLLKLIMMEERPDTGRVVVAGTRSDRVRRREVPALRRKIGMVYQDFRLLQERTVEQNLAFVLEVTGTRRSRIRARIMKVVHDLGINHLRGAYPAELSGGEQQKVAIARALVNSPFILLADEPTGNLDPESAAEILGILRDVGALGTTVVVVSHREGLLDRIPHRQIELRAGEVVDISPPRTVIRRVRPCPGSSGKR